MVCGRATASVPSDAGTLSARLNLTFRYAETVTVPVASGDDLKRVQERLADTQRTPLHIAFQR